MTPGQESHRCGLNTAQAGSAPQVVLGESEGLDKTPTLAEGGARGFHCLLESNDH